MVILFFVILPLIEEVRFNERCGKLKAVVNTNVSMMHNYEIAIRLKKWKNDPSLPKTIDEAKLITMKILREMRYDKNEYFFILDGNGNMVMHPLKSDLEGKNMLNVKDIKGMPVFRDLVILSQRDGDTFVSYLWKSKYSETIFEPQTTYAKYYWPWDWIVCSGVYTQDIIESMKEVRLMFIIYTLITAAITMIILFLGVHINLSKQLNKLLSGIKEIRSGNLHYQIEVASNDEIGFISHQFNDMVSQLELSRQGIIQSEKKYRKLTNMLPDIIYETDMDYNITFLNDAGKKVTGYTEDDIEKGLSIRDLISKNGLQRFSDLLEETTADDEKKIFATHKVFLKNGGYIIGENNALVIYEQGKPQGMRGVIRDVTEKLKIEESLVQTQKMETIGSLAGGLAHDFNNALSGIMGSLSLMKHVITKEHKIDLSLLDDLLGMMEESGQRATDIVQQLLSLSHKHELSFAPVDLNLTIKHIAKICGNTFDKSVTINHSYYSNRAMIIADTTQIEQVLLNLCVNAYHAMTLMKKEGEEQGGELSVHIDKIKGDKHFCTTHPEAEEIDYWRLTVSDTGVGMTTNTVSKIFDPFFTTKGKGEGTGLGLAMAYNIVRQHNGFIDVYSELGVGSTFNVYLPVVEDENYTDAEYREKQIQKGEGLILVIDDEEILRRIAKSILEECGYKVITAANGVEGITIFKERHAEITAVVLDLVMPLKSGEKVYQEMKEIDKNVKVLLASGFKQDERVEKALKMGINSFIQKPFTIERLARSLHKVIYG